MVHMNESTGAAPATGSAPTTADLDTYLLVPCLDDDPAAFYAVFADGSYVRDWIPAS